MLSDLLRKWITPGGPLLLIERGMAPEWRGAEGIDESPNLDTDYDLACEITDFIGVLESKSALVFGGEPMPVTWLPISESEGLIVRIDYANESEIDNVLKTIVAEVTFEWDETFLDFAFLTGDLVLFDSAYSYEQSPKTLSIMIEPGSYKIQTKFYEPTAEVSLLLHRLTLTVQSGFRL